jgi:hypothetical protein
VRHRTAPILVGMLTACSLAIGVAPPAGAATTSATATGKNPCAGIAQDVPAVSAASPESRLEAAAVGQYKKRHNTYEAQLPSLLAASAAQNPQKAAAVRAVQLRGNTAHCGTATTSSAVAPHTQINRLVQYGQIQNWYCGPATVSEMSATVPGPSPVNLDQNAVAGYMGTTQSAGTTWTGLVNGLNHYVGQPDFGRNFYAFVWISDTPTSAQRNAFISNLQTDVGVLSPVAGNGWEVPGGPHMTGHPANQEIFHIFEIGGYNSSQIYYADSATTVWSSVPAYSWFDTYTMVTILGGRGYAW